MLKITDLKPNVLIELEGKPYLVISASHQMLGRGHGMTKALLKNIETGAQIERVFRGDETLKEASLNRTRASYLYQEKGSFYFMDIQTFEQFSLSEEVLGFSKNFLKEGQEVEILSFLDKPININLPIKIDLKVSETEPGIRGGRETPGTKKAVLETGYTVAVPLFIKKEDMIRVDTREGKYVERVK